MTLRLFEESIYARTVVPLGERAFVLRGFALDDATDLVEAIARDQIAPFRRMQTRGGGTMSVEPDR